MSGFLCQTQMLHDCQGKWSLLWYSATSTRYQARVDCISQWKRTPWNSCQMLEKKKKKEKEKKRRRRKKKASTFKLGIADYSSLSLFSILRHATLTFQGHSLHYCLTEEMNMGNCPSQFVCHDGYYFFPVLQLNMTFT